MIFFCKRMCGVICDTNEGDPFHYKMADLSHFQIWLCQSKLTLISSKLNKLIRISNSNFISHAVIQEFAFYCRGPIQRLLISSLLVLQPHIWVAY